MALSIGQVAKRVQEFDLCALIELLEGLGYPLERVSFRGNTTYASASSLCGEIVPLPNLIEGGAGVEIFLNMGLLSASSPLPSYFRAAMEEGLIDEERFLSFLCFFDHHLIRNFVEMSLPERSILKEEQMSYYHLLSLGLECVSSLHWLIQLLFPELGLQVERRVSKFNQPFPPFKLGAAALGSSSLLGGYIQEDHLSIEVNFVAENERSPSGRLFALEIKERLRLHLFPLIKRSPLRFTFLLTIESYSRPLLLSSDTSLGYQRLGPSEKPMHFTLFNGFIKELIDEPTKTVA